MTGRRPQLHRRFSSSAADRAGGPDRLPAVVLCPGLIQNRFSFDAPTRSMTASLVRRGWCTYILEPHGRHEGAAGAREDSFVDVIEHDVAPTVADLCERHPSVAWVGHSLGGLVGIALPSEVSGRFQAMVTIGTPLLPALRLFGARPVGAGAVTVARLLHRQGVPFHGPWFGRAFRALKPLMNARRVRYPLRVYAPGSMHPVDLSHFLKHSWAQDSFGLVSDLLGLLQSRGERAGDVPLGDRLDALRMPLLVLGGDFDGLAPERTVKALYERAGSSPKELRIFNLQEDGAHFGHIDLLIGRRSPDVVWPVVESFLARYLD